MYNDLSASLLHVPLVLNQGACHARAPSRLGHESHGLTPPCIVDGIIQADTKSGIIYMKGLMCGWGRESREIKVNNYLHDMARH